MLELSLKYINYDENMSSCQRRKKEHDEAYALLFNMLKKHFGLINPQILKSENGKPYVLDHGVYFSISHTSGLVAVAVANVPVGVDCELLSERSADEIKRFASRFFTQGELEHLCAHGFDTLEFFKLWTGKEAVIKKRGSNMSDLKKIDVRAENIEFFIENGYIISTNI